MTKPASADELRGLERDRLRSLVEPDLALARRLHADDYQLIPPGGSPLSGAEYLGGVESGRMRYVVFEPASEIAVLELGDGAALRYQARIDIHFPDGRDGGLFWHTDIWRRVDGRWQAVWSQAPRIQAGSSPSNASPGD
jgi:hypothetical protein